MAKIPKNLSDKDMLKNWVEESSVEDQFMAAEKKAKQAAKAQGDFEPPADFRQAGFHPALMQVCSSRKRAPHISPTKSSGRARTSSSSRNISCDCKQRCISALL